MIENSKKNDTVTKLIKYFHEYVRLYENKLKANIYFNEIDERIHNNLSSLVRLSNERYKFVKSGNSIESVLNNQQAKYIELLKNLISEKHLYCSPDIPSEKKKFFKLNGNPKHNDITSLRNSIKDNNTNKAESISIKKNLAVRLTDTNKKTLSYKVDVSSNRDDRMDNNKNEFLNMLENDKKIFATQLDDYNNYLSEIKKDTEDKKIPKKFNFNTDTLSMLSFKNKFNVAVVEKKEENVDIDVLKLSKFAKPKKFEESKSIITVDNLEHLKNTTDYKQAQIVKNEIVNSFNIKKNIETKRQYLNKLMKDFELPALIDYEEYLNRKSFIESHNEEPNNEKNKQKKIFANKTHNEIKEEFKKNYDFKQLLWKQEDMMMRNLKRKDKENKIINSKFMNQSLKKNRLVPLFMDQYTQKDDDQVKKILDLNEHLTKKRLSRTNIDKKIDQYLYEIDKKVLDMKLISKDIKIEEPKNFLLEKAKQLIREEPEDETYHPLNNYDKEEVYGSSRNYDDNNINNKEEYYDLFKEYKKRIIDDYREQNNNKFVKKKTLNRSSTIIRKIDFNKVINQSPNKIISHLRRQSIERIETVSNISKLKTYGIKNKLPNVGPDDSIKLPFYKPSKRHSIDMSEAVEKNSSFSSNDD